MSSNKGSLLYLISEDLKTSTQSVLDAMATSVKALKETVEAGVNPEKSLKRKFKSTRNSSVRKTREKKKQDFKRNKKTKNANSW